MSQKSIKLVLAFLITFFALTHLAIANCIPPLPVPHANNAVAQLKIKGKNYIFSFAGLKSGKTWQDTSKSAFMYVNGETAWRKIPDLPVKLGRLAASAQGVKDRVYYFGGYTVAKDGSEKSTPEVFSFDPKKMRYKRLADMPTPVDDMVTFTYKNRYIYLVSGWHDKGNVNLVQIYDTKKNKWERGTDYPGTPVFGHAGGIVKNKFVIADGVAVVGKKDGKRIFDTVNEGWLGTIDKKDHRKIIYKRLPQLPGRGHYRMAGAGDAKSNQIIFMGGTPTAYNYNGIGYNGTPAVAKKHVFAWDFYQNKWQVLKDKPTASMDHRGMVKIDDNWLTIGGLNKERRVTGRVLGESLSNECNAKMKLSETRESEIKAIINQKFKGLVDAAKSLDIKKYEEFFYKEKFTALNADGTVTNSFEEFIKSYGEQISALESYKSLEFSNVEISVINPQTAILINEFEASVLLKSGDVVSAKGGGTQVWANTDNDWKIVSVSSSS